MLLAISQKKRRTLGMYTDSPLLVHHSPYHSVVAARGLFSSAVATGIFGFITTIVFLFCTPDFEVLFGFFAPQPFVQLYALALGKGGAVFMTTLATVGLVIVSDTYLEATWSKKVLPEY